MAAESKVVSLTGAEVIPPGTVRPELVAELESLLEMAKSGEIEGIAAAVLYRDDCTTFRLKGRMSRALIGVIEMMKARICYDDIMGEGG